MQATDNTPACEKKPAHALGVLWVHGIGEQARGETLSQFGTPVIDWINWSLQPSADRSVWGEAEVESASLTDAAGDGAPAHASIRIRMWPTDGGGKCEQQWLFAEGWWGGQVIEPKLRVFLGWLVTRGPWILLFHLHQCLVLRRWFRPRKALGRTAHALDRLFRRLSLAALWSLLQLLCKGLVALVLWNALSLLLVALWTCVSLIALVPIGRLRSAVLGLMQRIARVVGDSHVMVCDPTQRAALATAVCDAMAWLRPQCAQLAVVAHSQGAAVAHDVLGGRGAPKADLFVTVGAGLVKLHALMLAEERFPRRFLWAGLVAPVLAASLAVGTRLYLLPQPAHYLWLAAVFLFAVGLVSVVAVWESVANTVDGLSSRANYLDLTATQHGMRWRDFYSPMDPVPNGAVTSAMPLRRVRSIPVAVRSSMTADHTEYWNSRADFLPRLLRELARLAKMPLAAMPGPPAPLATLRSRYRKRLPILSSVRWGDWLLVLLPALAATDRAAGAVAAMRAPFDQPPFDVVGKFLSALDGALIWAAHHLFGVTVSAALSQFVVNLVLSLLTLVLVLTVWRAVFLAVWRWWTQLDFDAFRGPADGASRGVTRFLVDQFVGLVAAAPLAIVWIWTFHPQYLTEFIAYSVLAIVGGALVVATLVRVSVNVFSNLLSEWREHRAKRAAASAIEALEQMISALTVVAAALVGILALVLDWPFWSSLGATAAAGAGLAFVAGAIAHYVHHVVRWRVGDSAALRLGVVKIVAPPLGGMAAAVLAAVLLLWWMVVPAALAGFALIALAQRPMR